MTKMSLIETILKKDFCICLIFLLFYLTRVQSRCRRFDDRALDNLDFDKLSGQWNIVYSSDTKSDTSCSYFNYYRRDGTTLPFDLIQSSNQRSSGVITSLNEKKKLLTIGGIQYSFWILATNLNDYILTYQCVKSIIIDGRKQSKEVYRILSRDKGIEEWNFQKLNQLIKGISNQIYINSVSHVDCQQPIQQQSQNPMQPIINRDPLQPVINREPLQPTFNREPLLPSINREPSQPTFNREPLPPSINREPSQPTFNREPLPPSINREPLLPTINREPSMPIINKEPSLPTINREPLLPIINKEPLPPIINREPLLPIINSEPLLPVINREPSQPVIDRMPLLPLINNEPKQPVINYDPSMPVIPIEPQLPTPFVQKRGNLLQNQKRDPIVFNKKRDQIKFERPEPRQIDTPDSINYEMLEQVKHAKLKPNVHENIKFHLDNFKAPRELFSRKLDPIDISIPDLQTQTLSTDPIFSRPKKCRKFESQSIKNIDLNNILGNWRQLYASLDTNKVCTQISLTPNGNNNLLFREQNDCAVTANGILSKNPTNERTLKLMLSVGNTRSSVWFLDIQTSNQLLIYQCLKHESNGNVTIYENYRIFSRQTSISEPELENIKNLLNKITNNMALIRIPHTNCECNANGNRFSSTIKPESTCQTTPKPEPTQLPLSNIEPLQQIPLRQEPFSQVIQQPKPGHMPINSEILPNKTFELIKPIITKPELERISVPLPRRTFEINKPSMPKIDQEPIPFNLPDKTFEIREPSMPKIDQKPIHFNLPVKTFEIKEPSLPKIEEPIPFKLPGRTFEIKEPSKPKIEQEPIPFKLPDRTFEIKEPNMPKLGPLSLPEHKQQKPEQINPELESKRIPSQPVMPNVLPEQKKPNQENGCTPVEHLNEKEINMTRLSGKWYFIYSNNKIDCMNVEIEKSDALQTKSRYLLYRVGSDLVLTSIIKLETGGHMMLREVDRAESLLLYVLATDNQNYLITYKCVANSVHVRVLSRTKDPNPELLELANNKLKSSNVDIKLVSINQKQCDGRDDIEASLSAKAHESQSCLDLSDKAVKNIDLSRFGGIWYSNLINFANLRCFRMEEIKKSRNKRSIQDEYAFDMINENKVLGSARLMYDENGKLTVNIAGSRKSMTILDIQYYDYYIYYQCSVYEVNGTKKPSAEYGLISRNPTADQIIIDKAIKLFESLGLKDSHRVEQASCNKDTNQRSGLLTRRRGIPRPESSDYHCKNVNKFIIKNVDLNKLTGKWFGLYSLHPNQNDIWIEVNRNPNTNSEYTHIVQIINDEKVTRTELRLDVETGNLMAISDSHSSFGEFQFAVLDVDYSNHLIFYKCIEFDGSLSKIEKLGVFSRECALNDVLREKAERFANELKITDKLSPVTQYQCLVNHKFQTHILSDNCIHFHDSEIVNLDISRMSGQWDQYMDTSGQKSADFRIIAVNPDNNSMQSKIFPQQYTCNTNHINGSNLLNTNCGQIAANEAVIGVDYNSYHLKYSCCQSEENGIIRVSETLSLLVRPNSPLIQRLKTSFSDIFSEIPEISLNKVINFIARLSNYEKRDLDYFGQKMAQSVITRINKYQMDNHLSGANDKDVYNFLSKSCRHFGEEELLHSDISTIARNWSLDYSSYMYEKLPIDRVVIKKESSFEYDISLYTRDTMLSKSNLYYDKKDQLFWSFIDGRRIRVVTLLSNSDYRIVYSCDEFNVNDNLTANEILRFYSAEGSQKPRDWFTYLELLATYLSPKTWQKISDLIEKLNPVMTGCFDTSLAVEPMKTVLHKYFSSKTQFEEKVYKKRAVSRRSNEDVLELLGQSCRHFDNSELNNTESSKLVGTWRKDWSNWVGSVPITGTQLLEFSMDGNRNPVVISEYIIDSVNPNPQFISKSYTYPVKDHKFYYNIDDTGRRERQTVLWTDYDNYMIQYRCVENEVDDSIVGIEQLVLMSRNTSKLSRNINNYIEILANNLQPKTLAKIYQLVSQLQPFDINIVNSGGCEDPKALADKLDNKAMTQRADKQKLTFADELYYKFIAKGVSAKKINKIVVGKEFSAKEDEEVFTSLAKGNCRMFDDSELVDIQKSFANKGFGTIDWMTRLANTNYRIDSYEYELIGKDVYKKKLFLNNELVENSTEIIIEGLKWLQAVTSTGRRGIAAVLFSDGIHSVIYRCDENEINGVIAGKEKLRFISHSNATVATDLEVYLNKLEKLAKQTVLAKIADLVSNVRPISCDIFNRNCQRSKLSVKPKIEKITSPKSETLDVLKRYCLNFEQADLIQPDIHKMAGVWRVMYANSIYPDYQFDTIELIDKTDKLNIRTSLASKLVSTGSEAPVENSNHLEQVLDGKRALISVLYTDYSEHMVVYSCKENFDANGMGIFERLRLLTRNNSTKGFDLVHFQTLISTKFRQNVLEKISDLMPYLKPVYNESNDFPVCTDVSQTEVMPKNDDFCPDLDEFAQTDIDFKKLSGRWDAIYTSNNRWDNDCIYTVDSYHRATNSILQDKHTNNKTHKVLIRHSKDKNRQQVMVDNTLFQSWILATDYKTYRLSYTCYVKVVNGKKRKIDLQRLYTRNIEAKDFDKSLLEKLRRKASQIGKTLEPINRINCKTFELV